MLNVDTSKYRIRVRHMVATVESKKTNRIVFTGDPRDLPSENSIAMASEKWINDQIDDLVGC